MERNSKEKIAFSTIFLSISLFIGKFFGFIKEMLIAKYFGATYVVDAYKISTQIPQITSSLLVAGLGISFIPVFTEYLSKNREDEGWEIIKTISISLFVLLSFVTIIGIIFTPWIIKIIAPGFSKSSNLKQFYLSTILLRITMPYLLFCELGGFMMVILQSYQRWILIIIWQLIPNLVLVLSLVFFAKEYGIFPLAIGFLFTGILYFLILFSGVLKILKEVKNKYKFSKFSFNLKNSGILKILKLMFPVIIANCVIQLVPVIDRYLASYLKEGSIATLDYAYKLILFPITTLVWAFSSIIFPIFSFTYQENIEKFKNTVITCIRIIIFLSMPTFITLFVLSLPICRLVYERGTFNPFDTMRVSSVLKFYSLGIIGWGVVEILNRAFFSLQNTKIPLIIGVVASFFNIVGSITLVKFMGINGLALASALSIILNMVISFLILKKLINFNFDYLFLKSLISIFLGSILTGILIYFLLPYFETPYFLATLEGRITSLTFLIILTFGIYITLLYLFKNQELKIIYKEVIFKWREKIKMKIG